MVHRFVNNLVVMWFHTLVGTNTSVPINICSHITTELITHRCTVIGYFNKCNFSKHEWCAPWGWCDCTETCRSYFNANFNIVLKIIICALVGE